jgi:hypothetical protein
MSSILDTLEDIKSNDHQIIINLINGNNYTIDQNMGHGKLIDLMKFTQSKYNESKSTIYKFRDLHLIINENSDKRICYHRCIIDSYIDNGLLVNIVNNKKKDVSCMPNLKKYHSVVIRKDRTIKYNGINISFVEEHNNSVIINYFEINYQDTNKSKHVHDIIKVIS